MKNNNINIEMILIFPLIYFCLFLNSMSLIGATVTGILGVLYFFKIIMEKPKTKTVGITMFIFLYILMLNNYIVLEPILKFMILLIIIFNKNYKFWIKYFIINSILLFLLNIYYYYREYYTFEFINFISTSLIIIICIYKYRMYLVKWQIRNLNFNNKYFKFTHYLLVSFLYINNAILIKQAKPPEIYHITLQSVIIPILIFYVIYILIYPLIKIDKFIDEEKI